MRKDCHDFESPQNVDHVLSTTARLAPRTTDVTSTASSAEKDDVAENVDHVFVMIFKNEERLS